MTIKNISDDYIEKIKSQLISFLVEPKNSNILYLFKHNKWTITIYNNSTVLFQGDYNTVLESKLSFLVPTARSKKVTQDLIGCDESGVGDYFGPVVYACAYIPEDIHKNEELKNILVDSKTLNDHDIIKNYEIIKKFAKYKVYIDELSDFNEKMETCKNQNYLKVQNYYTLLREFLNEHPDLKEKIIILDQFTTLEAFKKHAFNIDKKGIKFALSTKAESKFLNVACASIIARKYYLDSIKKIEDEFDIKIKKGADNDVKKLAKEIKEKLPNNWESIIKKHFKL